MRENRTFAERTKARISNEVNKRYFLVFEGKETELIYFQGLLNLKFDIGISPLVELIPVIRSYSEDGWSNPQKILNRVIQNLEEAETGEISYDTLLNYIMDYLYEKGILTTSKKQAKIIWDVMVRTCQEQLKVNLTECVKDIEKLLFQTREKSISIRVRQM